MLTIIHGNDVVSSRRFFFQEKERFSDAMLLREDEVNLTMLAQVLEGGGLFEDSKTLFIEYFLSTRKKSSEKEAVIEYLLEQAKLHTIFLWEGKELERGVVGSFRGAQINLYKLPSSLFEFLDAVRPGGGKSLIKLFHSCLETTEAEMVFFMLVRQFRLLLGVSENSGEAISEIVRLAPWQKSKLEKQAKLFSQSVLIDLYNRLFQIEAQHKTGTLSISLIAKIDFFLLNI